MKNRMFIWAAVLGVLGSAPARAATNLVSNGDFSSLTNGIGQLGDNTKAAGWTSGGVDYVMNNAQKGAGGSKSAVSLWDKGNGGASSWDGNASGAANFVVLGSNGGAMLQQTVSGLKIGQTYDLTFDYAFAQQAGTKGDFTDVLKADFGNQQWATQATVASQGFSGWTTEDVKFVATKDIMALGFYSSAPQGDANPYALVSGVSLTESSPLSGGAPEPMTWAMMILGVAGLGGVMRRQRAVSACALA